jgi:Family of unknown function (DUF6526)
MQEANVAQNYSNHRRFLPIFHFFVLPVLLFNVVYRIVVAVRAFSFDTVVGAVVAIALLALALAARLMANTVQDRVIRLEMRLRLGSVLPPGLRARIPEFTLAQLVALRFASDAELPELAGKVLQEQIDNRNTIKKMVQDWQADYLRA